MSDAPTMLPAVGGSLFEGFSLLDFDVFTIPQCSPLEKKYSVLPEEGTLQLQNRDDRVAIGETQSDVDVDGVQIQGWVGDNKYPKTRKRRKQLPNLQDSPCHLRPERQRGKNWSKEEEDILVELKGQGKEWKFISDSLTDHGFDRSSDHCSMKWYALRKHYKSIKEWRDQHPKGGYWGLPESKRIRSVPSYFSQRWYLIFDTAEKKPEGKSKLVTPTSALKCLASGDPSSSHLGPTMGSLTLDSCPLLVNIGPQEGSQLQYAGDRICPGDGAMHMDNQPRDSGAMAVDPSTGIPDIQMLVTEIRVLSNALREKFETEEQERMRNFQIKERKFQLKLERFNYKRKRDEEKRNQEMLDAMVLSTR